MITISDIEKIYALLSLDRKIVGVKLVYSKHEFELYDAKQLQYPTAYCVAVKHAMNGLALKMTKECSRCGGSTKALGFAAPTEGFYSGQEGCALGLYESFAVGSAVAGQMAYISPGTYGVVVKPLEQFEREPDVVIIMSDSYTIMRIVQGYSYVYGVQPHYNILGNQAICVECTSYPMLNNRINISLLCSGTRFLAKWKETDVAAGIPYELFTNVIKGVRNTANAVETNANKKNIQLNLEKLGLDRSDIRLDDAYYIKLERAMQKNGRRSDNTNAEG